MEITQLKVIFSMSPVKKRISSGRSFMNYHFLFFF